MYDRCMNNVHIVNKNVGSNETGQGGGLFSSGPWSDDDDVKCTHMQRFLILSKTIWMFLYYFWWKSQSTLSFSVVGRDRWLIAISQWRTRIEHTHPYTHHIHVNMHMNIEQWIEYPIADNGRDKSTFSVRCTGVISNRPAYLPSITDLSFDTCGKRVNQFSRIHCVQFLSTLTGAYRFLFRFFSFHWRSPFIIASYIRYALGHWIHFLTRQSRPIWKYDGHLVANTLREYPSAYETFAFSSRQSDSHSY